MLKGWPGQAGSHGMTSILFRLFSPFLGSGFHIPRSASAGVHSSLQYSWITRNVISFIFSPPYLISSFGMPSSPGLLLFFNFLITSASSPSVVPFGSIKCLLLFLHTMIGLKRYKSVVMSFEAVIRKDPVQ